jgi:hypothetical protein
MMSSHSGGMARRTREGRVSREGRGGWVGRVGGAQGKTGGETRCVCVCVCWGGVCVCECVCERERERERERVCVCVDMPACPAHLCTSLCVQLRPFVHAEAVCRPSRQPNNGCKRKRAELIATRANVDETGREGRDER